MHDTPPRLLWFSQLISLLPTDRLVEIGCGSGELLELLAARVPDATLVGIDRSALQVQRARRRFTNRASAPQVHHLALESAPNAFAGERFAVVVAMNVNAIWLTPTVTGPALRTLLAPGGRVLLGVEPPPSRPSAEMLDRLRRAAAPAGFVVTSEHKAAKSRAVAVEWRVS